MWSLTRLVRRLLDSRGADQDPVRLHRLMHPVRMGTLRRTTPVSEHWGIERGTPIDRYYIEQFLEQHRAHIRGRVLELLDNRYTQQYGTVERSDVLDINPQNANANIICDLASADVISSCEYDCFLLIQTLQYIYDIDAAIAHAHRILKPGGTLLLTVPATSKIDTNYPDLWRFTATSVSQVLQKPFSADQVSVNSYGNVLAGIAFLTGMAAEELDTWELELRDDVFPVVVAARAVKT